MKREHIILGGVALVSLGIGATGGYIFASKRKDAALEEELQREIKDIKAYYQTKAHKAEHKVEVVESAAEKLLDEENAAEFVETMEQAEERYTREEKAALMEINNKIAHEYSPPEEIELDEEVVFMMTAEAFADNDMEYSQDTLTYYEGDDTLCDSNDELCEDIAQLLGDKLTRFGELSGDPNLLYVRLGDRALDLEIVRDRRKYAEVVLGFIEHEDRPQLRKFREYHD